MALTLPYPSISFVPLDVLTAEEMNHIVSNYTYIANQFPITPEKASFTAYSTTETVVGTWVDGKPIYRKVVKITNPQTSNTDYGIISNVMGSLVNLYGYMKGIYDTLVPIPQMDSSDSGYSVLFVKQDGTLRGRFSYINAAPVEVYVVVEYTKTTD
jgi:hypothetical protein